MPVRSRIDFVRMRCRAPRCTLHASGLAGSGSSCAPNDAVHMLSLTRYICEVADEGTAEALLGLRVGVATELYRRSHTTEAASAVSKVRVARVPSMVGASEVGR